MGNELSKYAGNVIKKLRSDAGMNQEELAKKLGVTKAAISNYETGLRAPKQDLLFDLSNIFGVSIDAFFPKTTKERNQTDTTLELALDHAMSLDGKPMTDHDREVIKRLAKTYMETKGDD